MPAWDKKNRVTGWKFRKLYKRDLGGELTRLVLMEVRVILALEMSAKEVRLSHKLDQFRRLLKQPSSKGRKRGLAFSRD